MAYQTNQKFPIMFPFNWAFQIDCVTMDTTDDLGEPIHESWQIKLFGNRLNPFRISL